MVVPRPLLRKIPKRKSFDFDKWHQLSKLRRISKRPFKFLHLYSGPNDPLGEALKAKRNRLEVIVFSFDSYETMSKEVKEGEWDFVHSGFPCGSFSMARHNPQPGQPGPVRDKANIYGRPGNTKFQQQGADRGTRMATQSADLCKDQVDACAARKVPPLSTMGNPPGNEVPGSAWDLPEVEARLRETGVKIGYNNCAYQVKEKVRFLKPGVWAGKMDGIESLQKVCRSPAWIVHTSVVGKHLTASAAEYPTLLCETVAKMVVNVWKKTLNLEWWRYRVETKAEEVNQLQQARTRRRRARVRGHLLPRGQRRWHSRSTTLKKTSCHQAQEKNQSSRSKRSTTLWQWAE